MLDRTVPSTSELERRACEAEAAALAVKGVTKSSGAPPSGIGGMVLVTSTGFHGSYLRSSRGIRRPRSPARASVWSETTISLGTARLSILPRPTSVGRSAGERTGRANPRKVETCKVPVVYDTRVSASLVGHLVGAINGASIARKTSFLKDRMGEQLFSKDIRIIDDPLRVRGCARRPSMPRACEEKLALIDEGVPDTWLLDCATARELGLATTGHAHRASRLAVAGIVHLHLEPGAMTPKELIADIKQGFYVTDLIGSGVNGVTGDYSRGASGSGSRTARSPIPSARSRSRAICCRCSNRWSRPTIWSSATDQRADAAYRGPDAWRTLKPPTDRARDAALLTDTCGSRCAGAVAVSYRIEELDQGRFLAGFRGRHRRQRPRGKEIALGHAGLWLAVGGERRRR